MRYTYLGLPVYKEESVLQNSRVAGKNIVKEEKNINQGGDTDHTNICYVMFRFNQTIMRGNKFHDRVPMVESQ